MGEKRLTRIKRLVSLRERSRDSAQAALSDANRKARDADVEHADAENKWVEQIDEAVQDVPQSIDELVDQRAHLVFLRQSADQALHRRRLALEQERVRRDEALQAQKELRKMELWSDNVEEGMRDAEARADQRKTDELATQITDRQKKNDSFSTS